MKSKISRGLRVLPKSINESTTEEYAKLKKDEKEIENWWKKSRWDYTTRTYSGKLKSIISSTSL
jgi:predicted DNA-binding protein (UPF0278 family)